MTRRLAVAWMHGKDALTQNRQLEIEMSALLLMSRARLQAEIIVCGSAALSFKFCNGGGNQFLHSQHTQSPTVYALVTPQGDCGLPW